MGLKFTADLLKVYTNYTNIPTCLPIVLKDIVAHENTMRMAFSSHGILSVWILKDQVERLNRTIDKGDYFD